MLQQIERTIIFRITKAFAWIVILPALIFFVLFGGKFLQESLKSPQSEHVSFDEVKAKLQENASSSHSRAAANVMNQDSAQYQKHDARLDDLLNAFGDGINREMARDYFMDLMKQIEEKDREGFLSGLIVVVKQAPAPDRPKSADMYIKIWFEKKAKSKTESAVSSIRKTEAMWYAVVSFTTVAVFSLLLVLLAIEKNTRNTGNAGGQV